MFTLVSALMLFVAANAQLSVQEDLPVTLQSNRLSVKPAPANRATISPTSDQLWWATYDTDENADWYIDGTAKKEHYNVATYIPADALPGEGRTIEGFSIYTKSTHLTNVKVWIATKLPEYGTDADLETVSVSSITANSFNDVAFTKKHVVPTGGLYVGYSFDATMNSSNYDKYPVLITDTDENRPEGYCINSASSKNWKTYSINLISKVLFGGGNFAKNAVIVKPSFFGNEAVMKGGSKTISLKIQNLGTASVSNVSYTVSTNGSPSQENTVTVNASNFQDIKSVNITLPADADVNKYEKIITITKVNGVANENTTKNTSVGHLITLSEKAPVTAVVEEFTGTWCGYCPYGMVGMQKAHDKYGDKVVLIAAHSGDIMEISDYAQVISTYAGGYPSSTINRTYSLYPYYLASNLDNIISSTVSQGSIELTAMWSSTDKNAVNFSTKSKFGYNDNAAVYGVAFALVEDGLTGSGSSWAQSNYLSGQSVEADMSWWASQGSSVSGVSFDHVVVAAWGAMTGLYGSVSSSFQKDQALEYFYQGDITSKSLIQDKSKLKAVALLLDAETGRVVNAAQANIQDYAAGIMDIENAAAAITGYYTLDGKLLTAPAKGVNIVKYSDGSTRKILMK